MVGSWTTEWVTFTLPLTVGCPKLSGPHGLMDSMDLYTKNGRPLQLSGDQLFAQSGAYLGRLRNERVYDPSGRYAGTLVGNRIVYRATDSATISSPSIATPRIPTARINAIPSAMLGDEPPFVD